MNICSSLLEEEGAKLFPSIIDEAKEKGANNHLSEGSIIKGKFDKDANDKTVEESEGIPDGWLGLDVGPKSVASFKEVVARSKLVDWNGPLGVFEFEKFAGGTKVVDAVAEATKAGCTSIIGGSNTATAAKQFGAEESLSHVSTGGGASLELLEGKEYPGVAALDSK